MTERINNDRDSYASATGAAEAIISFLLEDLEAGRLPALRRIRHAREWLDERERVNAAIEADICAEEQNFVPLHPDLFDDSLQNGK